MKKITQLLALTAILYFVSCTKEESSKNLPPITKKGAVILDDKLGDEGVKWPQNHTIKIAFINGTKDQHDFVKKYAAIWDNITNLSFAYQDSLSGSEIRIYFDSNSLSGRSFIGYTDNIQITDTMKSTMELFENLGIDGVKGTPESFELGTLRHEFGHMLGLIHEQLRSDSDIRWVDSIERRGGGNKSIVDSATLAKYLKSPYDRNSIMHYSVKPYETLDSTTVSLYPLGGELSQIDKDFIQSVYPNRYLSNTGINTF